MHCGVNFPEPPVMKSNRRIFACVLVRTPAPVTRYLVRGCREYFEYAVYQVLCTGPRWWRWRSGERWTDERRRLSSDDNFVAICSTVLNIPIELWSRWLSWIHEAIQGTIRSSFQNINWVRDWGELCLTRLAESYRLLRYSGSMDSSLWLSFVSTSLVWKLTFTLLDCMTYIQGCLI